MDKDLVDKTIEKIMERGNPKYTTPSGAFIEFMRDLAIEQKIHEISESLNIYCKNFPEASQFLRNRVPGILVNNYFTIREDLNYDSFIKFSMNTPEWANSIKENAFSPDDFVNEVERIIEKSKKIKI